MEKKRAPLSREKKMAIAGIAIALAAVAVLVWLVGVPLVKFASEPEKFRAWVDSHGIKADFAYVGMVILQVIVAVIPGEPFEIAGGYAFGAVKGTLLCIAACTAGSMIVFALVRKFGMKLVEVFFSREKLESVKFLKSSPKRDSLFLLIFMLPGTPKDLLSYFAGLTDIGVPAWLMICSLGRIPSIITSTVGGSAIGEKKYLFAVAVFVGTLLVSGLGVLLYNRIRKKHENDRKD